MAYITIAELKQRYGNEYVLISADRDADGNEDTTAIQDAIDDEAALMDSYIAKQYKLPLNVIPDVLVRCNGEMAVYRLTVDSGAYTNENRQRWEDWLKWLELLAEGKVDLGGGIQDDPDAQTPIVVWSVQPRIFSRDTLRGLF